MEVSVLGRPFVCPQAGVSLCAGPSDLGLQHLQEEFVHGHLALQFDAVEVLHRLGGRLPQQGQRQQQLARPPWLFVALAQLVVLQRLMQQVLQFLDSLQIFDVHGICGHKGERQGALVERASWGVAATTGPLLQREGDHGSERLSCQSEVSETNDRAEAWTQRQISICGGCFLRNQQEREVETLRGLNMSRSVTALHMSVDSGARLVEVEYRIPQLLAVILGQLFNFSVPRFPHL